MSTTRLSPLTALCIGTVSAAIVVGGWCAMIALCKWIASA
jgi:hypothetical protein